MENEIIDNSEDNNYEKKIVNINTLINMENIVNTVANFILVTL